MTKERKSRAFNPRYESPRQGILPGFEHPFDRELDPSQREHAKGREINNL